MLANVGFSRLFPNFINNANIDYPAAGATIISQPIQRSEGLKSSNQHPRPLPGCDQWGRSILRQLYYIGAVL